MCLLMSVMGWWMVAAPAHGIDPDIEKALRDAPPPGDMLGIYSSLRLPQFILARPEELDAAAKTEKYQFLSKLIHIKIPELRFKDIPGRAAFQLLAEQSVALDPEHKGVSFVFDPGVRSGSPEDKLLDQTVSLSHRDVPLDEAIRYVTDALNLRFDVEGGRVVIRVR
jgi:hypothetical protein